MGIKNGSQNKEFKKKVVGMRKEIVENDNPISEKKRFRKQEFYTDESDKVNHWKPISFKRFIIFSSDRVDYNYFNINSI